jgi:hypothetical protein
MARSMTTWSPTRQRIASAISSSQPLCDDPDRNRQRLRPVARQCRLVEGPKDQRSNPGGGTQGYLSVAGRAPVISSTTRRPERIAPSMPPGPGRSSACSSAKNTRLSSGRLISRSTVSPIADRGTGDVASERIVRPANDRTSESGHSAAGDFGQRRVDVTEHIVLSETARFRLGAEDGRDDRRTPCWHARSP